MQIHQYNAQKLEFNKAVITIGTFDGVHTGHRQIIEQLKNETSNIGGESVIITFHPHPRNIIKGLAHDVRLINTIEERIELLAGAGIDHLVVVPFTQIFSMLSADEYIRHFLIDHFHPHTIIIGYDHRFGHGRQGDYHLMEDYSRRHFFELKEIPPHVINHSTVSSTRIRDALLDSDILTANTLLGYDFFFEGIVVEGNKLGRKLGYPTANLQLPDPDKITPGNGIYAVTASLVSKDTKLPSHKGMMSIGIRPTIDGKNRTIEVNLFDFDDDIYGARLRVFIHHYLRPELKFDNLEDLKKQMALDKERSLKLL